MSGEQPLSVLAIRLPERLSHLGEVRIDPELRDLLPPPTKGELQLLEDSIVKEGIRDPIVIWRLEGDGAGGILIDGHTRLEIDLERVEFNLMHFTSMSEAKGWILRNQLGRRNLTESQGGMIAGRLATLHRGDNQHSSMDGCSRQSAAMAAGVSVGTLDRATRVLEHGAPELIAAVDGGGISARAAAEVTALPMKEQTEIVAAGPRAITEKAKKIRSQRKRTTTIKEKRTTQLRIMGNLSIPIDFELGADGVGEAAIRAATVVLETPQGVQRALRGGPDLEGLLHVAIAEAVKKGKLVITLERAGDNDTDQEVAASSEGAP
jgi:hypothetical protein